MGIKEKIKEYCNKNQGTKAEITLQLLFRKEFTTNFEIMMVARTTNPQKLIERLRKEFGYGFITDEFVQKEKTVLQNGKPRKQVERYKKYFLRLDFEGV